MDDLEAGVKRAGEDVHVCMTNTESTTDTSSTIADDESFGNIENTNNSEQCRGKKLLLIYNSFSDYILFYLFNR